MKTPESGGNGTTDEPISAPFSDVDFDAAVKIMSRQVHHLLECSTKKGAAKPARSVTNHHGFEAWKLLHRRCGRQDLPGEKLR